MKRFTLKIALLAPVLALVIEFNAGVDPAHLFSGGAYERAVAGMLLAGNNAANISDYDERLLQKLYLDGLDTGRDVIVLGSSRSMQVRAGFFPGQSFFNHSVSGATLEDDIAIYELYRRHGWRPSTVILGIDPWVLNRNHRQTRWRSLEQEYVAACDRLGLPRPAPAARTELVPSRYLEIISPAYFQSAVRQWVQDLRAGHPGGLYATKETAGPVAIKLADGSLRYQQAYREQTVEEVRQAALTYAAGPYVYSLNGFAQLDSDLQSRLEAFVRSLQAEGVQVVLFLPPYHPQAYRRLAASEQYHTMVEAEDYVRSLAARLGIPVLGSYNPQRCDCGEADFYDGMHPSEGCVQRIFQGAGK